MAAAADFSWDKLLAERPCDRPLIAGIVNAAPDSFSDGQGAVDAEERAAFALQLLADGADILDIGGESTRPGAAEVPAEVEWNRVGKVLDLVLAARPDAVVSIDTRHAYTAERALDRGAQIINDVSGLGFDRRMSEVISSYRSGAILTHSTGTPEVMQQSGHILQDKAVELVKAGLQEIVELARSSNIASDKLMLDVGIGFGKSREGNYALLRCAGWFEKEFNLPFCWGVSRKSLFKSTPDTMEKRIAGSLAMAVKLAEQGVSLLRVHDVAPTLAALQAARELCGE